MPESKTVLFLSNHFITLFFFRRELIERLLAHGHRVVLSLPDDERNTYFRDQGCEIIVTPMSRRGLNPVGKGDCGRCNAVFGVHPAGSAHEDVLDYAAGIMEVVMEVTALVRMGITGIEIGR